MAKRSYQGLVSRNEKGTSVYRCIVEKLCGESKLTNDTRLRTQPLVLQELSWYSDHELHDIGIDRAGSGIHGPRLFSLQPRETEIASTEDDMLDHVTLRTKDLEAAKAFFETVLGLEVGYRPAFPFPATWSTPPAGRSCTSFRASRWRGGKRSL